jgi:hypothetical protein
MVYSGISALTVLGILSVVRFWPFKTPVDEFWGPVFKSQAPILLCIGQPDWNSENTAKLLTVQGPEAILKNSTVQRPEATLWYRTSFQDRVAMGDLTAITRVTNLLAKRGLAYEIRGVNSASFLDLRKGPVVLFGAGDNPWTLRITDPLRFHFTWTPPGLLRIEDRTNPGGHDWQVDYAAPGASLKKDYAIVGRFFDATTGQTVVVIAGAGVNGTISGGEMVSNPQYLSALTSKIPANARNVEAVIETQVIDGKSGPPIVVASYTW